MRGVNVRLTEDVAARLEYAARREHRTVRQLMRNILRTAMAERGYLEYTAVPEPLLDRRALANGD